MTFVKHDAPTRLTVAMYVPLSRTCAGVTVHAVASCDCSGNDQEYTGQEAIDRAARLQPIQSDPREQGPKDEYKCPVCGEWWVADFPYHHWASDKRGQMYLRRMETLRTGRPLNAPP